MEKPKLDMVRPSAILQPTIQVYTSKEGAQRLAVDLPVSKHQKLKLRAAERGISVRDYILELLARDGI